MHNIPFELWLPKAYPREAPLLFVTPSAGIGIRSTTLVDPHGRVMLFFRSEAALVDYLRAVMNNLAMDPPFHPGAGRPMAAPYTNGPNQNYYASCPPSSPSSTRESIEQLKARLTAQVADRFKQLQEQLLIESDLLLAENTMLSKGEEKLTTEVHRLKGELERLQKSLESIRQQKEHFQQILDQAEQDFVPGTIVQFDGALANQIATLVVEDLSIQDLIYTLSKVFNDGKCPLFTLSTYLKTIREAARDQFMTKATLAKIRRKFPIITS